MAPHSFVMDTHKQVTKNMNSRCNCPCHESSAQVCAAVLTQIQEETDHFSISQLVRQAAARQHQTPHHSIFFNVC